jgi:hypothetical protein
MFKFFSWVFPMILVVLATTTSAKAECVRTVFNPLCLFQQATAAAPHTTKPGWNGHGYNLEGMRHTTAYLVMPNGSKKPISQTDEQSCLAQLVIGEAWKENDRQRRYIIDTVKNRKASGDYADTYCKVAHQYTRYGGYDVCQYSTACEPHTFEYSQWVEAMRIAKEEMGRKGLSAPQMVGVVNYHANYVGKPRSWKGLSRCFKDGVHIFYAEDCGESVGVAYIPRPPKEIPLHEDEGKAPALMAYAAEEPVKVAKVPLPSERPTQAIEAATADAMATAKVRAVAVLAEALKASAAEQPPPPPSRWDVGELEATNERVLTEMIGLKP